LLAYYVGPGTPWLPPVDETGTIIRIPAQDWRLGEDISWQNHVLHLLVPGEEHSVLLIWDENWQLLRWYINIEQAHVRTPIGFDYMDWTLDIVVAPDVTRWHWKDEEELEEAVSLGAYTREHADRMRNEGETALARLLRAIRRCTSAGKTGTRTPRGGCPPCRRAGCCRGKNKGRLVQPSPDSREKVG
jgi:predicted RNA-binding protein associated with RNAse of E/G family